MRLPRFRRASPRLRLDAFETWVAFVVACVVGLGLLGDTYQQYANGYVARELALRGLDHENWGDFTVTYFDVDPPVLDSARIASVDDIDATLDQAAQQDADVVALRVWTGDITNPATGRTVALERSVDSPSHAVAGFGIDWNALGLIADGRSPRPGEIAMSRTMARRLGVELGDTVVVSDPDTPSDATLTVAGIVRDPASWTFGNSIYLFASSRSYDVLVAWEDSQELSRALRPYPHFLVTGVYWNGTSETLESYFGTYERQSDWTQTRWGPGATEFVNVAGGVAALAGLLGAIVGSRPRRRPWRWSTPLRAVAAGAAGALVGVIGAAVLSLVTYAAFGFLLADLVQPRFALPRTGLYLWWLGAAAALALVLEALARARGARLWQSRPARAIAAFVRRAAPVARWLPALAGAVVLATIAWAVLDRRMVPRYSAPPDRVLVPLVIGIVVLAVWLAALVGRSVGRRVGAEGGRPGAFMPALSVAVALMAGAASYLAIGTGIDIAGDAAQRYDMTSADIASSFGLDETNGGDILTGLSGLFRTVDTGIMAETAIVLGLGTVAALLLAGLGGRVLTRSSQASIAAVGLAATVGAFLAGAVSGALLAAPVDVHDVSSYTDGLQPGAWTTDGALDVAFTILAATACVALATALGLALAFATVSVIGRARARLT